MNSNSIRVQFAFIGALLVTAPAYAGGSGAPAWSSIFFGQQYIPEQHLPQDSMPTYMPQYSTPPIVEYHNYTLPNGGRLNCSTYSNVTHCY